MRVAIIDLGTNSVRFDVHSVPERKLLHREKLMIRLGQGVFLKGRMDTDAIARAVHAFEHFSRVAEGFKVRRVMAFGTSALREAQDSSQLIDTVKERTGIEIKVISGREEAKLIALGILSNENPPRGRFALVDIGGGSTEVSVCRGRRVSLGESFPLGTARLQQVFLKRSPPRAGALEELRKYIRGALKDQMEHWPRVETVVGSSGTVKAVAKMLGKGSFSLKDLSQLVKRMEDKTTTDLLDIQGMEPKRVDMILAGAVLLEEILLALRTRRVVPTEFSLRDGLLEEEMRLSRAHKSSLIELHLDDLIRRSVRLGGDEDHLRWMLKVAEELFQRLRSVHKLESRWKVYLLSAVILRRVGEVVGYAGRERHAYYIVKNSDFPAMQGWEHEFVALLCLHLSGGKLSDKDTSGLGKEKARRVAFRKVLALLRLVDGLDPGQRSKVKLRKVSVSRKEVKIFYSGVAGVEQLLSERRKSLFAKEFRRQLVFGPWKKG